MENQFESETAEKQTREGEVFQETQTFLPELFLDIKTLTDFLNDLALDAGRFQSPLSRIQKGF